MFGWISADACDTLEGHLMAASPRHLARRHPNG
jgi:hypothetical protein